MALKYRKEVVGKRVLALRKKVSSSLPTTAADQFDNAAIDNNWLTGIARASTESDISSTAASSDDVQLLIEFDNVDWQKRDWLKVYEDFTAFYVEESLVLAQRSHPEEPTETCWWPALVFRCIVDTREVTDGLQPIEFLVDQKLAFVSALSLRDYPDSSCPLDSECEEAAIKWAEYQDGQRILVSTPTVLLGFRVKVYRKEGTTQWFTAVVRQYNNSTKELCLLDDTVLEEHFESAQLTQIIPLDGDGILKGVETRVNPRRRACKEASKEQTGSKASQQAALPKQLNHTSQSAVSRGLPQPTAAAQSANLKKGDRRLTISQRRSTSKRRAVKSKSVDLESSERGAPAGTSACVRRSTRERRSIEARVGSKTEKERSLRKRVKTSLNCATSDEDVNRCTPSPAATSAPAILTDMHIKKQRILGAVSDISQTELASGETSESGEPTLANSNCDPTTNNSISRPAQPQFPSQTAGSVEGTSSGYSSAATTESTVSPCDKHGQPASTVGVLSSMNPAPRSTAPSVNSSSAPSIVTGHPSPTLAASARLRATPGSQSDTCSPLLVETSKHSPLVPYRDPELLRRDAEVRKMAHTPAGSQQPSQSVPTTRSLPSGPSSSVPSLPQTSLPAAAALLNPLNNPQMAQHLNMQQVMQQYQMMEQYSRQIQAMQNLNPLQLSLIQHQAMQAAAQQQLALGSLYDRQSRAAGLPPATALPGAGALPGAAGLPGAAPWLMMPPFGGDKPLVTDLQREQELRAQDQKERAERAEREKQAKEKAEKERQEKEKERQQLIDRQERARILRESAQLAQDAVNQHFSESLRRMPHSASTSPSSSATAMMSMWANKGGFDRGTGDSGQPQDLSLGNKVKDKPRLDNNMRRQEKELSHPSHLLPSGINLADEKQKALARQSEAFLKSLQANTVAQQTPSSARLVEEHFVKAGLSQMPPKSEPAAYSLYGYQSQPFPHKYVSKDQLQQQLCKDEKLDKSPKSTSGKDVGKRPSQGTPPRTATSSSEPQNTHVGNSRHLIQEGLIPNPDYAPLGSMASSNPTNSTSSSISALVSMSMHAGSHIPDKYNKDKSPPIKSEPLSMSRANQPTNPPPSSGQAIMKSFKSYVESAVTQAFYKDIEEQTKKESSALSPPPAAASIKSEKTSNGAMDTDSDTLSAPSPTLGLKDGQDQKPCHPKMKLKKEWLQRHAEGGTPPCPTSSSSPTSTASGTMLNSSTTSNLSEATTSASETESEQQGVQKHKAKKRKSDSSASTTNGQNKKSKNCEVSSGLLTKDVSRSSGSSLLPQGGSSWPAAGGDDLTQSSYDDEQDSMKQLAEIAFRADRMQGIPYASKPLVRVNITTLKRTLEPFVQDGSCIEMAPKLSKCRECKLTPNQRNKKIPNIFCRFYAFRLLKFNKNGQICIAGFCDPTDAEPDDITIWLPHIACKKRTVDEEEVKTAKYIIANVGEEFCRLVEQEQDCINWSDNKRAWKRAVQGVREMCDVCDTTLFNTHWVCHRCGFVVCIDCYRVKRRIQTKKSNNVCEENRRWLSCTTNKNHEADKLMLTSIIPSDALKIARDLMHHVKRKHGVRGSCACVERSGSGSELPSPTNGLEKQDVYRQSTYLSTSLDNKTLNTYSDDPLSLLADVASMAPTTAAAAPVEVKVNGNSGNREEMDTSSASTDGEKKACTTLRKLLTKTQANGSMPPDKKVHDIVSTVVDPDHSPKAASWESHTRVSNQHEFVHYQRRSGAYLAGRAQAIPTCYLKETSLLYPNVKHSWLCEGKLLRLLDSQHPNNFELFNQRWRLGQPVIVSNVSKNMKVDELWTPKAFSNKFGHIRHDLIDCRRNEPLSGYQIKCFWDGFEDQSKRLTDAEGQPLILKLKDWPTAEDFAESMPARFQDLMSALPMPQYTQRNGQLNLAGRLPEFFVKPDLGPKMYIAYGLAKYPQSGTTNLHLDVSDAVNVMVFVAHEEHLEEDVMKLIDDSDCDELMKRRITEDGETPGALWHIYDACDADKMRDLLNKVALELGMELEPYHDPIHDQQFYLDRNLRQRLADEYGVYGYPIIQCVGDAVFIPAGAPHQVQNLNGCIKVAEDFVSPEHLHHCFNLTQEFRHLSNTHANHEDKLQVKNIIYHAIKDAVAVLDQTDALS